MAKKLTEKQMNERVRVVCYNQLERMTRRAALDKYLDGMMACDSGSSEYERYANIYCQLQSGATTVSDKL